LYVDVEQNEKAEERFCGSYREDFMTDPETENEFIGVKYE